MRSQKNPLAKTATLVPGSTKLLMAASMPPLPVAEMTKVISILGAEDGAQHALNAVRNLKKVSVQVADDGLRHRLVDARMDLAGAGAVQETFGRMDRNIFHECSWFCGDDHEATPYIVMDTLQCMRVAETVL